MSEREQNYRNHRRWFPLHHFVVLPILTVNLGLAVQAAFRNPSWTSIWALTLALTLILFAFDARIMALKVQDRVIRLEMRLRLQQVLPPALAARAAALRTRQLVGLRFASDAELPGLVERCLSGELGGSDDVKRAITAWQPDWFRA